MINWARSAAFFGVFLFCGTALAAPKVGVVDVKRVMEAVPEWTQLVAKLKGEWEAKQRQLEMSQADLRQQREMLENKALVADPEVVGQERNALITKAQGLAQTFVQEQQRMAQQEMQMKDAMLRRIEPIVNAVATQGDYDYVFERGAPGSPNVLYSARKADLTAAVLKLYKEKWTGKAFDLTAGTAR